jgi:hypothetical protein
MSRPGTRQGKAAHPITVETTSMFKKLIPVIALALIAGPVLAADPPAGGTDQAATSSTKSSHKKHHSSSSKHKSTKPADTSSSSAPK